MQFIRKSYFANGSWTGTASTVPVGPLPPGQGEDYPHPTSPLLRGRRRRGSQILRDTRLDLAVGPYVGAAAGHHAVGVGQGIGVGVLDGLDEEQRVSPSLMSGTLVMTSMLAAKAGAWPRAKSRASAASERFHCRCSARRVRWGRCRGS